MVLYYTQTSLLIVSLLGAVGAAFLGQDTNYDYSAYLVLSLRELYDDLLLAPHCLSMQAFYSGSFRVALTSDVFSQTHRVMLYSAHVSSSDNWVYIQQTIEPDIIAQIGDSVKVTITTKQESFAQVFSYINAAISNIDIRQGSCFNQTAGRLIIPCF